MCYDFHIHSTYSDGSTILEDIFKEVDKIAKKKQQSNEIHQSQQTLQEVQDRNCVIAITDHDTVLGIEEESKLSVKYNIPFIPGVEFSAVECGVKFHVLAYNINYKSEELIDYSNELLEHLNNRSKIQIDMLKDAGIDIEKEEYFKESKGGPLYRAKLLKTLSRYGYLKEDEIMSSLKKYFGKDGVCYLEDDYKYMSFQQVCDIIKRNDGIIVLAHPAKIKKKKEKLYYELINSSLLDGVELYHPSITEEVYSELDHIIKSKDLIFTGGSDYHGIFNKNKTPLFGVDVPQQVYEQLHE